MTRRRRWWRRVRLMPRYWLTTYDHLRRQGVGPVPAARTAWAWSWLLVGQ